MNEFSVGDFINFDFNGTVVMGRLVHVIDGVEGVVQTLGGLYLTPLCLARKISSEN